MIMHVIFAILLMGAFAIGVGAGVMLTIEHYEAVEARQHADEQELAEAEEQFAARAALRAGIRWPPSGNPWPDR